MNYQPHEDEFLKANYLTTPTKRMSKMLGRTETSARQRMKLLGIVAPPEIIEKFKQDSRFKKGASPVNKGKKQTDFLSAEAIERTKATRFKKGQKAINQKPIGSERITKDGYAEVKIADPNKWRSKHVIEWEKHNGKVPKEFIIVFKTADKMNTNISNLEIISYEENMRRNSLHNYPKPIALTIQLRGALNRQIRKHIKRLSA